MILHLAKWKDWQGRAVRGIVEKRAARGTDHRLRVRLDMIQIASDFSSPEFRAFAAAVGGRVAETYWVRILQYVALHDPVGGTLPGDSIAAIRCALYRPWDGSIRASVIRKVLEALKASGLATPGTPSGCPRDAGGYTPGMPEGGTPEHGPIVNSQGVTAETARRNCADGAPRGAPVVGLKTSKSKTPPYPPLGGGASASPDTPTAPAEPAAAPPPPPPDPDDGDPHLAAVYSTIGRDPKSWPAGILSWRKAAAEVRAAGVTVEAWTAAIQSNPGAKPWHLADDLTAKAKAAAEARRIDRARREDAERKRLERLRETATIAARWSPEAREAWLGRMPAERRREAEGVLEEFMPKVPA